MTASPLETLTEYFSKFPGIGPRAARRFVYFLLSKDAPFTEGLLEAIRDLKKSVAQCPSCFRYFRKNGSGLELCDICRDEHTDQSTLLVVEKDADFENTRKSGSYPGLYFILGGAIPILEKNPTQKIRGRELFDRVQTAAKAGTLKEVILAMNATAEGENTALYVSKTLEPLAQKFNLKISSLGRGLATGTELEYSDAETFKSALKNRG